MCLLGLSLSLCVCVIAIKSYGRIYSKLKWWLSVPRTWDWELRGEEAGRGVKKDFSFVSTVCGFQEHVIILIYSLWVWGKHPVHQENHSRKGLVTTQSCWWEVSITERFPSLQRQVLGERWKTQASLTPPSPRFSAPPCVMFVGACPFNLHPPQPQEI